MGVLRRSPSLMIAVAAGFAVASRHHLALTDANIWNKLFSFNQVADLLAAFAFLCRTLMGDHGAKSDAPCTWTVHLFVHMLVIIQQSFSAYYFVHAFAGANESNMAGAGLPSEMLSCCGILQLALCT